MQAIVVGYDGSQTAARAVHEAAELAAAFGAALHIVAAVDDDPVRNGLISDIQHETALEKARIANEALVVTATADGGLAEILTGVIAHNEVRSGNPGRCLVGYADEVSADLIVVGNRRTQGIRRLLGSVAVDVVRHAPCSVYVAHTLDK